MVDTGPLERIEDHSGDPSVHAFLQRVSSHLAQVGQGLPRSLFNRSSETVFKNDIYSIRTLVLPDKQVAKDYVAAYFDHGNATCRFLLANDIYQLLNLLYENNPAILQNHAQMAMILLLIGTGCVWSASWRNEPVAPSRTQALPFLRAADAHLQHLQGIFPPSLNVMQAQLLKCQCELVLGRFNSAWVSLGIVIRLAQMVNIQKEQESQDPLETYHRRFLFWSIFIIDRYLAVILGRPLAIHEGATSVKLSVDLDPVAQAAIGEEKKLLIGTVAHGGLVRIIGNTIESLYSAPGHGIAPLEQKVTRLEMELRDWVDRTPKFFHPLGERADGFEEDFYEVSWILRRQQRTVHATFYFANMLLYRGYLLRDFLNQAPSASQSGPISDPIAKCVENARMMIALAKEFGADKYNGAFWITSHFVYCAISILMVYIKLFQDAEDRSATEETIEEAMGFHRKLDSSPNIDAQKLLEVSIYPLRCRRPPSPNLEG
ncbi:hypothetical protein LZ31DRAFT_594440 [Colletotrichum somersetense]|nr:hypothetical protein LZ31DRAFT_594440 [Colletotrichum somersetense]